MDPEIEELKELVRQNTKLAQDTNRLVHKLRRNIWWGRVWSVAWWIFIFLVAGGAYYYYAEPYVQKLEQYYAGFQSGAQQAQSWEQQAAQWFAQLGKSGTTTNTQ